MLLAQRRFTIDTGTHARCLLAERAQSRELPLECSMASLIEARGNPAQLVGQLVVALLLHRDLAAQQDEFLSCRLGARHCALEFVDLLAHRLALLLELPELTQHSL